MRRWTACLGFFLSLISPAVAASLYEHPLLTGGGNPSTQADFPQKLSDFIYHRPIDNYAGSEKQWRFLVGVDYKL
jgi:hypothetical protein